MANRPRRKRCRRRSPKSFAGKLQSLGIWIPCPWANSFQKDPNYFHAIRKLFGGQSRLYKQDHSRGRGLTTTGQPTVSLLPLKALKRLKSHNLNETRRGKAILRNPSKVWHSVTRIAPRVMLSHG